MKKENLIGRKNGKLTVVEMLYNYNNKNKTYVKCICDCGNTDIIKEAYAFKKSKYPSCGCGRKHLARLNHGREIDGMKFGRLNVLETYWDMNPIKVKARCECGNTVIISKRDIMSGHTSSCGCLSKEITSKNNMVDHTGKISDYGIEIINPSKLNKNSQWLWNCKCGICGTIFEDIPARILSNHVKSCGCIKRSANEELIESILKDKNLNYQREYTFEDLKTEKNIYYRYDFAVFDDNDNVESLIEYDGEQHFKPIEYWGGEEGLLKTKQRDSIKNNYCTKNNIPLYRIDYTKTTDEIREIINTIYP